MKRQDFLVSRRLLRFHIDHKRDRMSFLFFRFFILFSEKEKEKGRIEKRVWGGENVHHLAHVISVVDSQRSYITCLISDDPCSCRLVRIEPVLFVRYMMDLFSLPRSTRSYTTCDPRPLILARRSASRLSDYFIY